MGLENKKNADVLEGMPKEMPLIYRTGADKTFFVLTIFGIILVLFLGVVGINYLYVAITENTNIFYLISISAICVFALLLPFVVINLVMIISNKIADGIVMSYYNKKIIVKDIHNKKYELDPSMITYLDKKTDGNMTTYIKYINSNCKEVTMKLGWTADINKAKEFLFK